MKLFKLTLASLAILSTLLIESCSKQTGPEGPTGPAGPKLTGKLTGFTNVFDQYGTKLLTSLAGVTVSIDGTTKTTTTDANGKYSFDSLTTGIYSLTYTLANYGTVKTPSIEFTGGGEAFLGNKGLSAIPNFNVSAITITDSAAKGNIYVTGQLSATDTKPRQVAIFIGNSTATSFNPSNYLTYYTVTNKINAANPNGTNFLLAIPHTDLYAAGLATGSTAYFAVYSLGLPATASAYVDENTGRTVFTAIGNSSSAGSILVP